MFAEAIQAERLGGRIDFFISADFFLNALGGPLSDVNVKNFAIANDRREQEQIAALLEFAAQAPAKLVACLRLNRKLTVGAVLRAETRKEQAQKMVNLGNGRDCALAAAAAGALFDADGRRNP